MTKKILVVDDNPDIRTMLKDYLTAEGFEISTAENGQKALFVAREEKPDCIILDMMMPEMGGQEFIRTYTAESDTPILVLTARVEETDKVLGLELGADDYVTKPFSIRELIARIKAQLRSKEKYIDDLPQVSRFGDFEVNFDTMTITKDHNELMLTSLEADILRYFIQHENKVITRDELLDKVWGYENYPSTRTVDNLIVKLRKKIETDHDHPRHIVSVYGRGYRFNR